VTSVGAVHAGSVVNDRSNSYAQEQGAVDSEAVFANHSNPPRAGPERSRCKTCGRQNQRWPSRRCARTQKLQAAFGWSRPTPTRAVGPLSTNQCCHKSSPVRSRSYTRPRFHFVTWTRVWPRTRGRKTSIPTLPSCQQVSAAVFEPPW
jgi:hypothetical protein